jgi:hypothetical protein
MADGTQTIFFMTVAIFMASLRELNGFLDFQELA